MVLDENIIDVEHEEVNLSEKSIRGKVLYYSTSQVAQTLGETDSKIRYYTNVFDDILNIEISNKQRRYTDADINKLKFIIELKNDGMTIKQIQEYCAEVDINDNGEVQVKESNPLTIQAMAKALLVEQQNMMNEFKEELKKELLSEMKDSMQLQQSMYQRVSDEITEKVTTTVDELVNEKLTDFATEQKVVLDEIRANQIKELELFDKLRESMNNKKKEFEDNKGLFSRLFRK